MKYPLESPQWIRAKRMARYVLLTALKAMLLISAGIGAMEFFGDGLQLSDFRHRIVMILVLGLFVGFARWWDQDKRAARLEADLKGHPLE